ncbi:MAG: lipid A Kdo2 1-phosphate O-methyltransferase [Chlorobi bacterium]|nr:lipid A Kdo2 1-phosphate O-methyltransferase [Chlorobiota bacterium]
MKKKHWMVKTGNFLFRYRGQIPVFFFLLALVFVIIFPRNPGQGENLRIFFYFLVSLTGLFIRIDTIGHVPPGTSGRNRTRQVAETLNTSGWYSIFRHPLYIANYLLYLGPLLLTESVVFILFYLVILGMYYKLISLAEDDFLAGKFGDVFTSWESKTPAFLPVFNHYKPPLYPFSLKKVLINEYHMILEIPLAFTAMITARIYGLTGRFHVPIFWIVVLAVTIVVWIAMEIYHHHEKRKWQVQT